MALFLAGLILSGIAVALIYGVGTILNDLIFDSDCRTRGPHNDTLFVRYTFSVRVLPLELTEHSLFIFVTHIILWTLTVQKRNATAHNGWMRQKIVHMVVRDGAWIFFLIFCTQHYLESPQFFQLTPLKQYAQASFHTFFSITWQLILSSRMYPESIHGKTAQLTTFT